MIKGMTGFGSVEFVFGSGKALVEIKSVNHRYLDINFYLPVGFGIIEDKIRQLIQKQLSRGRVTVSVKIIDKPSQKISLNQKVVEQYVKHSKFLVKQYKVGNNLNVSDLLSLPGVFESKETLIKARTLWPTLEKSTKRALSGLILMRSREGKSLCLDISDKLRRMLMQLKKIETRSRVLKRENKKKMSEEEFTAFQKSSDINEEIARLKHYIEEVKKLLKSTVAVGKKIDFIAQEMQRETNTIGSKQQDSVVSNAVIALKSKIEKIREQSQNVE